MNNPVEEYKEIKFNNNYIYKQSNDYNDTMNLSKLKVDKEELSETLVDDNQNNSNLLLSNLKHGGDNNTINLSEHIVDK